MSEYGYVTMVTVEPTVSTVVTVAATAGATSLTVDYAGGFDESGGTLDWTGTLLAYSSVVWGAGEEDPDQIILTDPLPADALVDDVVSPTVGGAVLVDHIAHVVTEDGDSHEVPIPFVDRLAWPEGIYEEPVAVEMSDDGTVIENAPGRMPQVATSPDPARGLKLDYKGLIVYDSSGLPTLSVDPEAGSISMKGDLTSGSTVTGATIATGVSGERIVLRHEAANPRYSNFPSGIMEFFSNDSDYAPGVMWGAGQQLELVSPGPSSSSNRASINLHTDPSGNVGISFRASKFDIFSLNGSADFRLGFTDVAGSDAFAFMKGYNDEEGIFVRCADSTDPNNVVIESRAKVGATVKPLRLRGRTLVLDPMKSIGGTGVQVLGLTDATASMFRLYVDSNGVLYKAATAGL